MENLQEKIKKESQEISKKVKSQIYAYIATALGLVAGLAWNEAIKSAIDFMFPLGKNTLLAKFLYALIMTLIVVLISIYLSRFLKEDKE